MPCGHALCRGDPSTVLMASRLATSTDIYCCLLLVRTRVLEGSHALPTAGRLAAGQRTARAVGSARTEEQLLGERKAGNSHY